ncbi:MAG: DUF3784 domain-containing protein [Ruminococcus sp.]|nr:DUF3784 domain-containing protein [Ruminococcus sp.]
MDYVCIFLGMLFVIGGIIFAFGKIYKHLSLWKIMPDEEKKKIKIAPLCKNIGAMITLNGIIFVVKGFCTRFSDHMFTVAIILWIIVAGIDVFYISKSNRYSNQ